MCYAVTHKHYICHMIWAAEFLDSMSTFDLNNIFVQTHNPTNFLKWESNIHSLTIYPIEHYNKMLQFTSSCLKLIQVQWSPSNKDTPSAKQFCPY